MHNFYFFFNIVELLNINKQDHQYKINYNIFVLILVHVSACNQELHHVKIVLRHSHLDEHTVFCCRQYCSDFSV